MIHTWTIAKNIYRIQRQCEAVSIAVASAVAVAEPVPVPVPVPAAFEGAKVWMRPKNR
jgi:hypothetical protein